MIYFINKFFQKGIKSQIVLLILLTVSSILIFSSLFLLIQPETSFGETLWIVSTRMLDPGTFSGDAPSVIRWITYPVTISGVLLMSTLIGIISASITDQLIQLRRGIGTIQEENFTLIIGWNYRIFHLIQELIESNSNQDRFTLVILAAKDKIEMDEEISLNLRVPRKVKIITRNIDPLSVRSYRIINIIKAKSILLLTSTTDGDFLISKCLLLLHKMITDHNIPIIFEVDSKYQSELIKPLLTQNTFPIERDSFFSKLITQTTLQSGMSNVFSELFSFRGNEIYTYPPKDFVGKSYGESILSMKNASLIGIIREGITTLNPDHTFTITEKDKLVVIMNDDDSIICEDSNSTLDVNLQGHTLSEKIDIFFSNILILGWNSLGKEILWEFSKYTERNTTITIVSDEIVSKSEIEKELNNDSLRLEWVNKPYFKRQCLESLDLGSFDKIVILSADSTSPEESDTITISTILQLKALLTESHLPKIISQILVERNVSLLDEDPSLEFIVSDSLVTGMISQIAENSDLFYALNDILDEEGCEIYAIGLSSMDNIIKDGISVSDAYSLIRDLGGSMIGYQSIVNENGKRKICSTLNPIKDAKINLNETNRILAICEG